MTAIVTKDSLQNMLNNPNPVYVMHVIGRALVALFAYQTGDEQKTNNTKEYNNVGFTGADGKGGSLTAKSYMKHGKLEPWQVERWTKRGKNGYSRLCKYHNQLNYIAEQKKK
jgi:hypothetical protein